jgi:ParB-like chromosome segregation protein Spo0J
MKAADLTSGQVKPLKVIDRSIEELKLDPANPRVHSNKQIQQIADSIKVFGFNVPILVDHQFNVIAGHGRVLAARTLGMTQVPILCLDHLTRAEARAFMIADNKLTENSAWNDRLLAEQLRDLSLLGLDFSLEIIGFQMGEIDLRIASLEEALAPSDDPADILPETPVAAPVSQLGDLWRPVVSWSSSPLVREPAVGLWVP